MKEQLDTPGILVIATTMDARFLSVLEEDEVKMSGILPDSCHCHPQWVAPPVSRGRCGAGVSYSCPGLKKVSHH